MPDFLGALETAEAVSDDFTRACTFTEIAEALAVANESNDNRQILASMLKPALALKSNKSQGKALCAIAEAQSKIGDLSSALDALNAYKYDFDTSYDYDRAVAAYALGQIKSGNLTGALQTIDFDPDKEDSDFSYKVPVLYAVAAAYVKTENMPTALRIVNQIKSDRKRLEGLCAVAVARAETGKVDALQSIDTAETIVISIKDGQYKYEAYLTLAKALIGIVVRPTTK